MTAPRDFTLVASDLHPAGACTRCGRVMLTRSAHRGAKLPPHLTRVGAHGLCASCYNLASKAKAAGVPVPPVRPYAIRETGDRGKCKRCGRPMMTGQAFAAAGRPADTAVYGGEGYCSSCKSTILRAEKNGTPVPPLRSAKKATAQTTPAPAAPRPRPLPQPAHYLGMAHRGEARSVEANTAARDDYLARRRARLAGSQARALRSALSSGWDAI